MNPAADDTPSQDDDLVAYLDGELEPSAVERIERRLAAEPQVRERLRRLEAAWELLDELPQVEVEDLFTRTTVAMVVQAASQELAAARGAAPRQARRRLIVIGGVLLAAALAGFAVGLAVWPDPNRELLADLSVLVHIDHYQQAGDAEFLRALDDEGLDLGPRRGQEEAEETGIPRLPDDVPDDDAARREWVASLDEPQREELLRRRRRFDALDADSQRRLRQLDAELAADPRGPELRRVAAEYHAWRMALPLEVRPSLQGTPQQRVAAVARKHQAQHRYALLAAADHPQFYEWWTDFLREQFPEFRQEWQHWARLSEQERIERWNGLFQRLDESELIELRARVSPAAVALLEAAADIQARREIVADWVSEMILQPRPWQRPGLRGPDGRGRDRQRPRRDEADDPPRGPTT